MNEQALYPYYLQAEIDYRREQASRYPRRPGTVRQPRRGLRRRITGR